MVFSNTLIGIFLNRRSVTAPTIAPDRIPAKMKYGIRVSVEVSVRSTKTMFCVTLCATAPSTETAITETRGYTVYIKTEEIAIDTTPPVKLYKSADTLPAYIAPSPVRTQQR